MRTRNTTVAVLILVGFLAGVTTACEAVDPPDKLVLDGHGWGHARGMGQWGAYGYAVDHGWSGSMILDRFYAGTVTSKVEAGRRMRVLLAAQNGKELIVHNQLGLLQTNADGYAAKRSALRVARVDDTRFRLYSGSSCAGPWTPWSRLYTGTELRVRTAVANSDPRAMLQLCLSGGTRYYRGELVLRHVGSSTQTINHVRVEDLVRSVIAKEMSPSWADAGGGRGAAALRAQAVAARSYALAGDTRWRPHAQTCDTTSCQVYGGYGSRANGSSNIVEVEDPRTDAAAAATADQVRTFTGTTRIASTEFSSSTGGWTAGGTFPIRPDDGDDTTANPNHSWTTTISAGTLEAAFDRRQGTDLGDYLGTEVLDRNGYGDWGGRVLSVRVRFSRGSVTLTGDQFRSTTGIRSSWFRVR